MSAESLAPRSRELLKQVEKHLYPIEGYPENSSHEFLQSWLWSVQHIGDADFRFSFLNVVQQRDLLCSYSALVKKGWRSEKLRYQSKIRDLEVQLSGCVKRHKDEVQSLTALAEKLEQICKTTQLYFGCTAAYCSQSFPTVEEWFIHRTNKHLDPSSLLVKISRSIVYKNLQRLQ